MSRTMVADTYLGTNNVSRTINIPASAAFHLTSDVIETIGETINSENPDLCIDQNKFDKFDATTSKEAMRYLYYIF